MAAALRLPVEPTLTTFRFQLPAFLLYKTLAVNQQDPRPMAGSKPQEGGTSEGEKRCCLVLTCAVWFHLVETDSVGCLTVSADTRQRLKLVMFG